MNDKKGRSAISADPADPRHGTDNGYRNLGCRCDQCTQANTLYVRRYRAARPQRQVRSRATKEDKPALPTREAVWADLIRVGGHREIHHGHDECEVSAIAWAYASGRVAAIGDGE